MEHLYRQNSSSIRICRITRVFYHEKIIKSTVYILPVYTLHIVVGSNFNLIFMKILDNLIQKVGNDKTLHFLGGGFICSFISFIVILQESGLTAWEKVSSVLIGTVFVLILSVLKELIADDKSDLCDVLASILGCVPVYIAVGIGAWFNILSA